jgi:hypothetical protein
VARMGVWGKGQQSLAPPQHAEAPEREQRFGTYLWVLRRLTYLALNSPL